MPPTPPPSPRYSDVPQASSPARRTRAVIVGRGRIGTMLANEEDTVISAHEFCSMAATSHLSDVSILVCGRTNTLETLTQACPYSLRENLVFFQNGDIIPLLSKLGVDKCSKVVLYVGVPSRNAAPQDGVTPQSPDGLTVATGKWASNVADRFRSMGLTCGVVDEDTFLVSYYEKLVWLSAFNIVGASRGFIPMDVVATECSAVVLTIMKELLKIVSLKTGTTFHLEETVG
ncbi:hypothetical protein FGB62_89g16 [Gracilaria domingensis]|nr:hypothetical protein FGB62_89g16 [Gracilaria domingensis]